MSVALTGVKGLSNIHVCNNLFFTGILTLVSFWVFCLYVMPEVRAQATQTLLDRIWQDIAETNCGGLQRDQNKFHFVSMNESRANTMKVELCDYEIKDRIWMWNIGARLPYRSLLHYAPSFCPLVFWKINVSFPSLCGLRLKCRFCAQNTENFFSVFDLWRFEVGTVLSMISAFRFLPWCGFLWKRVKELRSLILYSPFSDFFFSYPLFFFLFIMQSTVTRAAQWSAFNFFALQNHSNWSRSQKHYIDTGTCSDLQYSPWCSQMNLL